MKNWKTTSAGILTIVTSLVGLYYSITGGLLTAETITMAVSGILVGIGLIFSKDKNVTGVGTEAQTKSEIQKVRDI